MTDAQYHWNTIRSVHSTTWTKYDRCTVPLGHSATGNAVARPLDEQNQQLGEWETTITKASLNTHSCRISLIVIRFRSGPNKHGHSPNKRQIYSAVQQWRKRTVPTHLQRFETACGREAFCSMFQRRYLSV